MNRNRRNGIKIMVFSSITFIFVTLFFISDTWALDLSRKKKKTNKQLYIAVTKKDRCW